MIDQNQSKYFDMVNNIMLQAEGDRGDFVLSIANKPVEFSRYADVTLQFAPFLVNRKSLLTKLYAALEQKALLAENYTQTGELLCEIERHILRLAEELPFEINCQKLAMGQIIKAVAPEIEDSDKSTLEKIFAYMELVRELDKDRLFIMINMRTYFSDDEMERFAQNANKAARNLGKTTKDFADASLIYYQQGLSGEEVLEKTNTSVKMALYFSKLVIVYLSYLYCIISL